MHVLQAAEPCCSRGWYEFEASSQHFLIHDFPPSSFYFISLNVPLNVQRRPTKAEKCLLEILSSFELCSSPFTVINLRFNSMLLWTEKALLRYIPIRYLAKWHKCRYSYLFHYWGIIMKVTVIIAIKTMCLKNVSLNGTTHVIYRHLVLRDHTSLFLTSF